MGRLLSSLACHIHWEYAVLTVSDWLSAPLQHREMTSAAICCFFSVVNTSIITFTSQCRIHIHKSLITTHQWYSPVSFIHESSHLNSHFIFCRISEATCFLLLLIFFPLWWSDHCRGDWNGTVVCWLFSCHILPVAVTWPLSQARRLIQSQRRGHWLLPGLRDETLGILRAGVGRGEKRLLLGFLLWNSKV